MLKSFWKFYSYILIAIINGIVFFIICSLLTVEIQFILVYCSFILQPCWTCLLVSYGLPRIFLYLRSCCVRIQIILLLFQRSCLFSLYIAFSITLSKAYNIMLNRSGESKNTCIFPGHGRKAFSFYYLDIMVAVGFSYLSIVKIEFIFHS